MHPELVVTLNILALFSIMTHNFVTWKMTLCFGSSLGLCDDMILLIDLFEQGVRLSYRQHNFFLIL